MPDLYGHPTEAELRRQPAGQVHDLAMAQPAAAPQQRVPTTPLDSFSVGGRTGNNTTNADLPKWLRDLGMKGDAYAGGMLKPELRYGFAYKGGKIHFADGTSFVAKKQKDGSFTFTGSDGTAQRYSPTDEQNAYNQAYKKSTSNNGFFNKVANTLKFELDHGAQIVKGITRSPGDFIRRSTFGIDPLGTKIANKLTGRDDKPLVDQLGGALDTRYADYENRTGRSTGFAKPLQDVAHVVASYYGAKGLGGLASAGVASLGSGASALGGAAGGGGLANVGQYAGSVGQLVKELAPVVAGRLSGSSSAPPAGGAPTVPGATGPGLSLALSPRMRARQAARPHNMDARINRRNIEVGAGA